MLNVPAVHWSGEFGEHLDAPSSQFHLGWSLSSLGCSLSSFLSASRPFNTETIESHLADGHLNRQRFQIRDTIEVQMATEADRWENDGHHLFSDGTHGFDVFQAVLP